MKSTMKNTMQQTGLILQEKPLCFFPAIKIEEVSHTLKKKLCGKYIVKGKVF